MIQLGYALCTLRRALLVVGILLVAIAGAIWAWVASERARVRAEHEHALTLLSNDVAVGATEFVTCVLGDDATASFERVRLAEEMTPTPGGQWPIRCAPYALAMVSLAARSADAGIPMAIGPMRDVDAELRNGSTEHLMEAVAAVKPLATKKADTRVPRPSAPIAGGIAGGSPMYARDPKATIEAIDQLDGELHVTLSRAGTSASCVIDATSFAIHCTRELEDVRAVLAYAKGASPSFFHLGSDGSASGATDGAGKMLVEGDMYVHGYAYADGRLALLANGKDGPTLALRSADAKIAKRPSTYGSGNPRGAGDYLVWKAIDGGANDPATVRALHLEDGAERALGKVDRRPDGTASSSGHCASATTLFVDMSPAIAVLGRAPKFVGAASLLKVESQPGDAERSMTCDGDKLRILDVSMSSLRVQDCDASPQRFGEHAEAACIIKSVTLDVADGVRAASLGADDFVLVWRKRWGVVAARGALDSFLTPTPLAIVTLEPPKDPLLRDPGDLQLNFDGTTRVVSVSGGAIVFVHVMSKVHAYGIRRDGTVVPIIDPEK